MPSSLTSALVLSAVLIVLRSYVCSAAPAPPPTRLTELTEHERNFALSLSFLNVFITLKSGFFTVDHRSRDAAYFSQTCDLLAQYRLVEQMPAEYEDIRTILNITLQDGCLHFRNVYGPLPGSDDSTNNTNSTESCRGSSIQEQDCCQLNYLQKSCASHLKQYIKQDIKETAADMFGKYSGLEGYRWCDWITRNLQVIANTITVLFSWCIS